MTRDEVPTTSLPAGPEVSPELLASITHVSLVDRLFLNEETPAVVTESTTMRQQRELLERYEARRPSPAIAPPVSEVR